MKVLVALTALVAIAFAQHHFDSLIQREVQAIIAANAGITAEQCTTKCDGLFDLIDAADESHTDDVCKRECGKSIVSPDSLMQHEVQAIIAANPGITADQCTTKCDGLFDLIDATDESRTDRACRHECDCAVSKNCGHHTQAPHPTRPHNGN